MIVPRCACRTLLLAAAVVACTQFGHGAETLRIDSVLLELIEQADVPARDPGVIEALAVKEGDLVEKGDTLIQLDTVEMKLDVGRAKLELSIARQESKNDVDVRFAKNRWRWPRRNCSERSTRWKTTRKAFRRRNWIVSG